MVLIVSKSGLAMAIENTEPIILLLATNDGSCAAHVRYAADHNVPSIVLPSREDIGEFIGGSRKRVVCSAVLSFIGHEEMLSRLLLLG